jgi:bacillithiol synthase
MAGVTVVEAERGAGSPLNVEVRSGPLRGGGQHVRDYQAGARSLAGFYAGHSGDIDAYRRRAAEVDARLTAQHRSLLAPAIEPLGDAADRLRRILAGDGYFITTGQQPALYGGPLYTLYKVLAAIRLAAALEPVLRRPVLALFWIGADDHDWDEANRASLLDANAYVRTLRVDAAADAPALPLSQRRWGADILRVNRELAAALQDTPFAADVMRHVELAYTPQTTVEAAFTQTMRLLLGESRVALIGSAHPALRRAAAPVLRREVEHAAGHYEVVARQSDRLAQLGYPAQVELNRDAANVMLIDELGRDRLVHDSRGWRTRRGRRAMSDAELIEQIETQPERFSPNVLLRPVVESATLPTIAYVAGPGELRYFAQIGCLFAAHGIAPPVVVPRPSVTLLDARARRLLERLGLEADDFARPYDELVATVIRREVPASASASLQRIRDELRAGYAELIVAVEAIDPTLAGPLTGARNRSLIQAFEAEKRIVRHFKRRNSILLEQLRKAAASLQPEGAPQERVLAALPLLAQHGSALAAAVEETIDMEPVPVARWGNVECEG